MLAGDENPANDAKQDTFQVAERGAVAEQPAPPGRLGLEPARPNPCQGRAVVRFSLPEQRRIVVDIISADGRFVRRLCDGLRGQGLHAIVWDGLDDGGRRPAAGVYCCRLLSHGEVRAEKLVLTE
jgi:hypothetical protein